MQAVLRHEIEVVRAQLKRNDVVVIEGAARFTGPHSVEVATYAASIFSRSHSNTRPKKVVLNSHSALGLLVFPPY